MTRLTTHLKTAVAAAAVAAVLPAAASAAPKLDGTFPAAADPDRHRPGRRRLVHRRHQGVRRIAADGTVTDYETPGNSPVTAITAGPDTAGGPTNRIWLAYTGGVIKVDPASPNAGVKHPSADISGSRDMATDRDGNLWVVDGRRAGQGHHRRSPDLRQGRRRQQRPRDRPRRRRPDVVGRLRQQQDPGHHHAPVPTTTTAATLTSGYQGIAAGPNGQIAFGQPGTLMGRINPGRRR